MGEYFQELFFDERKDPDVMKGNFASPPILKDEVRAATKKMKNRKATGPDGISVELIEALGDFGFVELTELLNKIYDTKFMTLDKIYPI